MTGKLERIATALRRDVLVMTTAAKSGHPTSCMSAAELMAALFFSELSYDPKDPHHPGNDEFVLSKGHAAPVLYAALAHAGAVTTPLVDLRKFGSPLEGHPMPSVFPWAKVATGSLGQGPSVGVGMAFAFRMRKQKNRVYVLCGDSEVAEGSVYEALMLAVHEKLDNLCLIVDVNRLGQTGETMQGHDISSYADRFAGFGAHVLIIDGHDIPTIKRAFSAARKKRGVPTVILARTYKGKGVSFLEDKEGWHGRALDEGQLSKALAELPASGIGIVGVKGPHAVQKGAARHKALKASPKYRKGDMVATRQAYGNALLLFAKQSKEVIALDGEVQNSTFSISVQKGRPSQFVQCYIAEQDMVGIALGLAVMGMRPFVSTFGAFLSRAADQIRMASLSSATMIVCGSHAGVSIGEDGPSQMALEDLSLFRALLDSTVLYPSDAVAAERLLERAAANKGITYIRTGRPKTPVIYPASGRFPIGGFKVHPASGKDQMVIVGAGITLYEALAAQAALAKEKVFATVVDCYSVKPFDAKAFARLVRKTGDAVLVAEDHYPEGGIGEMIASALASEGVTASFASLAVRKPAHSGPKDRLLAAQGIDAAGIARAAEKLMRKKHK